MNINLDLKNSMLYVIFLDITNSASHTQSLHHATSDQNLCCLFSRSIIHLQLLNVVFLSIWQLFSWKTSLFQNKLWYRWSIVGSKLTFFALNWNLFSLIYIIVAGTHHTILNFKTNNIHVFSFVKKAKVIIKWSWLQSICNVINYSMISCNHKNPWLQIILWLLKKVFGYK